MYQGSALDYSQYDRDMAMYRGDLGYMWEWRDHVRDRSEVRPQQSEVRYIPNRYFNSMNRGNPQDLMQVEEKRVCENQMFDNSDRVSQMNEGYGYPQRVNPMMRVDQTHVQPLQPLQPLQPTLQPTLQERQMNNPFWINESGRSDYLYGCEEGVRHRMRQGDHGASSRRREEAV